METESDVITYEHYRIPQSLKAKRKSMPSANSLYPWNAKTKRFFKDGFPLASTLRVKENGGRTVCKIKTASGEVFTGVMYCSMSQKYLVDYGEDTAYNRARVAQGHECAYCRNIVGLEAPKYLLNDEYLKLLKAAQDQLRKRLAPDLKHQRSKLKEAIEKINETDSIHLGESAILKTEYDKQNK